MDTDFLKKTIPYIPAALSGALTALAFPVHDLWGLAWVSLVPLLFSLWGKDLRDSFWTGFVFGVMYFFGTLYWVYHSISVYGGIPFVVSIALVFLLCLYLGLYPALFAMLIPVVMKKTKLPMLAVAPVLWVSLEFLRAYALTGFPWSSLGYSQYRFLHIIQIADITGIYGISFLIVALNGAVTDVLLLRRRLRDMPLFPLSYTIAGFVSLLAVLVLSMGYGFWRLGQERSGTFFRAGIVQGNIDQNRKWDPLFQEEVLNTYFSLSQNTSGQSPDLLVWPETSVPFFFNSDKSNTEKLIEFQRGLNTNLLFGSVLMKENMDGSSLSNSAVLLDRTGKPIYKYDKIHLVPFGEYVPLKRILFFVDKLVTGIGDYVPGTQHVMAGIEAGRFGTLICYEIIFPGLVRKFYTKGGDFIVTMTNDAWFGRTAGPHQHFSMAVFRAVENRKPVIRSANTGVSGFIDSNGRIISKTPVFEKLILTELVKTDSTVTPYTRYGDLFSFFCIVTSIILLINVLFRR